MRNLKKVLAVICVIAMMASMLAVPALAADYANEDEATTLNTLGVMAGMNLGDSVTRIQGLTFAIKAAGNDDEAQALTDEEVATILADVVDAADIPEWGLKYAAYAVKTAMTSGTDASVAPKIKFSPTQGVSGDSFLVWLLRSMGYTTVGTVDAWEVAITEAKVLTLSEGYAIHGNSALIRDDVAGILYSALDNGVCNDGTAFVDFLITAGLFTQEEAAAAGLADAPAPVALAVASITTDNLRNLVVTFNKAPVADEAKKASNYKINGNAVADASLSEDGLTVTLRTTHANRMGNYSNNNKLEIAKAVGFTADAKVESIAVKDTTVPTIVSVEVTGPRNLKVTFSEPLDETVAGADSVASLKIDNALVALDPAGVSYNGKVVSLKTYADFSEGNHTIEVVANKNMKDSAGYVVQAGSVSFAYAKDTAPLSAVVEKSTETSVTLKFNKAIKTGTLDGNANLLFTHTYNTTTNQVGANDTPDTVTTTDDVSFTINFTNPLPPGTTTVYLKYTDNDAQRIEDNYGNKLAATEFTVTTTADLTKPTVSSVEFVDATTVKVTFSEDVQAGNGTNGAENPANYTLKTGSDTISVTAAAFDGTSKSVVKLTTATMNGGEYTLTIKKVVDRSVAKNELAEVTVSFTGTDKVPPTIKDKELTPKIGIQVRQIADKKVKIEFSEAMDPATITDKANYKYDNAALHADATLEAVDGNKAVIFTNNASIDAAKNMIIGRVKDAAGNWIEVFSTNLDIEPIANIGVKTIEVTGKNSVKLVIEDVITGMTTADFEYDIDDTNGDAYAAPTALSVTIADGKTYITLTTADINDTTAAGAGEVRVRTVSAPNTPGATTGAKNPYDQPLEWAATGADDKYAPKISSSATKDIDSDGKLDSIDVTYSENLYAASVVQEDFTVEGYEVTGVVVTGAVVQVSIKEKGSADTAAKPKITQVGSVEDSGRNALGAQDGKTPTDAAGPAITSIAYSGTTITVTFSEAISDASLAADGTDFTVAGTAMGAETWTAASGTTANDNTIVLTLSADPTPDVGETITVALSAAGVITDGAAVVSTQTAAVTYTHNP